MKKTHLLSLLLLGAAATNSFAQTSAKVHYVSLSGNERVTANPIKEYVQQGVGQGGGVIKLYPQSKHQTLMGIGGCFNEIGGEALASLEGDQQQELIGSLFANPNGGNMVYCRMSVGSSDFGIDAYSFSPVADDYTMEHFSMEREAEYMLPYIKKAVQANGDIKIFGSPWSPPAWMKHSGYMDRGIEHSAKNTLKDEPRIYEAYALYFAKYIEAYRDNGIEIDRVLIQNEQDLDTKYPSCRMPVEQMSKFVQGYLSPLLKKRKIDTEIWGGTFRTYGELDGVKFASSEKFHKDFDGIGIQYTSPQYIADIRSVAPTMKIMHTESNCFDGANSMEQARTRFAEVASYINGGCENFAYWNMILNETGLSGWDWKQNSLITINRDTKSITYNPDYAVMNIMSRFLMPGSVRISTFSTETVISVEHQGKYYVMVQNDAAHPITYSCNVNGDKLNVEIPGQSLSVIELQ